MSDNSETFSFGSLRTFLLGSLLSCLSRSVASLHLMMILHKQPKLQICIFDDEADVLATRNAQYRSARTFALLSPSDEASARQKDTALYPYVGTVQSSSTTSVKVVMTVWPSSRGFALVSFDCRGFLDPSIPRRRGLDLSFSIFQNICF